MAFLTRGLKITLKDERIPEDAEIKEPRVENFHYEGGISEFVAYLNKSKTPLYDQIMYFEGDKNEVHVEVSVQHNDAYNESEELSGYVMDLRKFDELLKQAQEEGSIIIEQNVITGIEEQTFQI